MPESRNEDSREALLAEVYQAVYDHLDTSQNAVQIATCAAETAVDTVLYAIHERDISFGDSVDSEVLSVYRHIMRTIYGWMK